MSLQTKYISVDEFNQYFPETNLIIALGTQENALAFLKRIEDRMETFINANFNKNIDLMYPRFNDYQKEHYKLALLEQAIYIIRNSDISVDSGADIERGIVIKRGALRELSIAENAKQHLILCGVYSRHITSRTLGGYRIW